MGKLIGSVGEFPQNTRFILIVFKTTSVYTPGDARSRTNPGHGYPESTDTYATPEFYAFDTIDALRDEVARLYGADRSRQDVLVLEIARQMPVSMKVSIDL